ncbi:hypothetical protein HYW94_04400 [Candidatus Uhrbacteria bacterium]|nr:hypothetical protein [Candidatus Uhrbacteria bacterium]
MSGTETNETTEKQEGKFSMKEEYENSFFTKRKPRMDEFEDTVYPHDEIVRDLEKLGEVESRFKNPINALAARHLELIIGKNSDKTTDQWLGKNASVYETTDFDDSLNHVDMVVEFHDPQLGLIRLGVDVTTAHEEGEAADRKRALIKKYADSNLLFPIKYFKGSNDQGDTFLGEIHVPRSVVFVPTDYVEKYWNRLQSLRDEISTQHKTLKELQSGKKIAFTKESDVQKLLDEKNKQVKEYEGGGLAGLGFASLLFNQIITSLEKLLETAHKKEYRETIEKTLACLRKEYAEKKKEIEELEHTLHPSPIKKVSQSRKK